MRLTQKAAATLLVGLLLAPAALSASPRTEYRPYNVGVGLWAGCPGQSFSVGGVCFLLDGSESSVTITVFDSTFNTGVPAHWSFKDANDVEFAHGEFCDSTGPLAPPSGTVRLHVWIGGPLVAPAGTCMPGLASTGLVRAEFA